MARDVWIDYTNYKGERRWRHVRPTFSGLIFSSSEWHSKRQWLLQAFDYEKKDRRSFAMADIHAWRDAPPPTPEVKDENG